LHHLSRPRVLALLLVGLTAGLYAPVTGFEFVAYDDDLCITHVEPVRQGLSLAGLAWAFTSVRCGNWYPLTHLSWMADAALFGMNAGAFHLTNAILHLAAAIVFFFAFVRLTGAPFRSFVVAAAFAVHPLHVESVAWATSRKDVLSGLFAALALLAYAPAARSGSRRRHALVAFWLACGLLSKVTLVVWPLVLLLVDFWPLRRFDSEGRLDLSRLRPLLVEKLPLLAMGLAMCFVTVWAQNVDEAVRSLDDLPLLVRAENALASFAAYTADAFVPRNLAVFYPYPAPGSRLLAAALGAALLASGFVVAALGLRRAPFLAVGWLWYVGALVPVIGLVQVGQAARADRYTYLPIVGLALAVVWGLDASMRSPRGRRTAAIAAVLVLLGFTAMARDQLETWRNSESLFRHALRVTEKNHVAHINLGLTYAKQERFEEASQHLVAALHIAPRSPIANGVLGQVRLGQGREREAIALYQRAIELDPANERWQRGLEVAQASRRAR
jgi:tetratricopeptide (TPR) repeat protein